MESNDVAADLYGSIVLGNEQDRPMDKTDRPKSRMRNENAERERGTVFVARRRGECELRLQHGFTPIGQTAEKESRGDAARLNDR